MILTLRPGEKFEIPVDAYTPIVFGTPFTGSQLLIAESAEQLSVIYTKDGESGSWPAVADGTGIRLEIEPGMVEVGFYALKPRAVIDGRVRKYKKAIAMHVMGDGETI